MPCDQLLPRPQRQQMVLGALRSALSARDCGPLEILVRGVDVDPDALRRRLRPAGHTALSVVITRLGTGADGHAVAFVCRPSS